MLQHVIANLANWANQLPSLHRSNEGEGSQGLRPIEDACPLGIREPIQTPRMAQDPNSQVGNVQGLAQHFQQKKEWATDRAVIVLDPIANG